MLKKIVGTIWRKMPRFARRKIVSSTQSSFTVSVAALISNEKMEVLLLDHVLRVGIGWGFPGGFVNKGEQPEQALKREVREETCLELENVKLLRARTTESHIEILFSATSKGEAKVNSREIKSFDWFASEALPENMSEAQKALIKNFQSSNKTR